MGTSNLKYGYKLEVLSHRALAWVPHIKRVVEWEGYPQSRIGIGTRTIRPFHQAIKTWFHDTAVVYCLPPPTRNILLRTSQVGIWPDRLFLYDYDREVKLRLVSSVRSVCWTIWIILLMLSYLINGYLIYVGRPTVKLMDKTLNAYPLHWANTNSDIYAKFIHSFTTLYHITIRISRCNVLNNNI